VSHVPPVPTPMSTSSSVNGGLPRTRTGSKPLYCIDIEHRPIREIMGFPLQVMRISLY